MEKIFHASRNQKKVGVAILTSNKIDFNPKMVTRDNECHCIRIKGLIHQDI